MWTPPSQPSLQELKWFRFLVGRIGGYDGVPIIVSRTGYTGELGYEVFCHPADGEAVWDAVWKAGEPRGMLPLGLEALDMLRIESGLIFAGYEFDDQVDPFEAGIGFAVALDDEDFVGRDALLERREHPQRRLVGLELGGNETAGHGDEVYVGPPARRRGHQRHPQPDAEEERSRCAGCRSSTPSSTPRSRWASSTGCRSGSRPASYDFPSMTRRRSVRGRDHCLHAGARFD